MSVRASTESPRACSGDMYLPVPITMPVSVFTRAPAGDVSLVVGCSVSFASPKSSTFA